MSYEEKMNREKQTRTFEEISANLKRIADCLEHLVSSPTCKNVGYGVDPELPDGELINQAQNR